MKSEIQNKERDPEERKFLNFCSPIYKRYRKILEQKSRKGYESLQSKIRESAVLLQNVRNGKSLFENTKVIDDYHIPVLKESGLRRSLVEYLDKSLIEVSVKEADANLALIESLSPKKLSRPELSPLIPTNLAPSVSFSSSKTRQSFKRLANKESLPTIPELKKGFSKA